MDSIQGAAEGHPQELSAGAAVLGPARRGDSSSSAVDMECERLRMDGTPSAALPLVDPLSPLPQPALELG